MQNDEKKNAPNTGEQKIQYPWLSSYDKVLESVYQDDLNGKKRSNTENHKMLDVMVAQEAVNKVREYVSLEHPDVLGRAFFHEKDRLELEQKIRQYVLTEKISTQGLSFSELIKRLLDEIVGLGPLEELMKDMRYTEIMVNGPDEIYVESSNGQEKVDVRFDDEAHVQAIARKMLNLAGASVNIANPIVDARLPDSRINIVIPPVARNGTTITIRKFPPLNLSEDAMINGGLLTKEMLDFLKVVIKGAANIIVVGATGSGKTTLIKRLCEYIPEGDGIREAERILTIEDTEELRLKALYPNKHIVSLECRYTDDAKTNVDMGKLLHTILRMKPNRILVGEVRGPEAYIMIEALNTGHSGGLTSLHANNARDSIRRLIQMILRSGLPLGPEVIGDMVTDTIDIVVFQSKMKDGSRRITEIAEVLRYDHPRPVIQHIFKYRVTGVEPNGKLTGYHERHQDGYITKELATRLLGRGVKKEEILPWLAPQYHTGF